VNLQPARPGPPQASRAPEALKRDQRLGVKGERDRVRDGPELERRAGRFPDDARGVAIERVGRAVGRLGAALEEIEERRAARADEQRAGRAGQELGQAQGGGCPIEELGRERQEEVEAERADRARQLGERAGGRPTGTVSGPWLAGRQGLLYRRTKGYCVVRPSDGGKAADLTAFSTQPPVGVPANLPVTVAEVTLPLLPMTMLTIAIPPTLNSL